MILWVSISAGFRAYTLVDLDTNEVTVISNTSEHRGSAGVPPEFIENGHSCNALLRAGTKKRFIYSKSSASTSSLVQRVRLRDAIEAWQQGRLMEATDENACKEHRDH